jgi:hypothetical protein
MSSTSALEVVGGMRVFERYGTRLLVPQGDDGIQVRGFPCGVDAKDQADSAGDAERCAGPEHSHVGGERRKCADEESDRRAEEHADEPTHCRERDRFQSELQQDVPLGSANRLAHADLARPLGDRDKHDVHHAHTADDQTYAGDCEHEDENAARELVPEV